MAPAGRSTMRRRRWARCSAAATSRRRPNAGTSMTRLRSSPRLTISLTSPSTRTVSLNAPISLATLVVSTGASAPAGGQSNAPRGLGDLRRQHQGHRARGEGACGGRDDRTTRLEPGGGLTARQQRTNRDLRLDDDGRAEPLLHAPGELEHLGGRQHGGEQATSLDLEVGGSPGLRERQPGGSALADEIEGCRTPGGAVVSDGHLDAQATGLLLGRGQGRHERPCRASRRSRSRRSLRYVGTRSRPGEVAVGSRNTQAPLSSTMPGRPRARAGTATTM